MKSIFDRIEFKIDELEKYKSGVNYRVSIKIPLEVGFIEKLDFITETTTEKNNYSLKHVDNRDGFIYFSNDIFLPTKALYHFYFSFLVNGRLINYKNSSCNDTSKMWKLSVNYDVPRWAMGKIMYHIFVDRFNKLDNKYLNKMPNRIIHSNWNEEMIIGPNEKGEWNTDFYGGTLEGITDKLEYIKSLGVSIIYLSPIVMSQSNHRYDTADYEIVDPYVGRNIDLKILCDKAHSLGIKIVLDAVFNHTGNDSKYFNQYNNFKELGAYQSKKSKYYDFYRKHVCENKVYFDYWWGMHNLPECDSNSKKWQDYIYGVNGIIDKWFEFGIDGLRLDVADELSDEFIEGIRNAVRRNKKDGFILGEVWKNPMQMNRGYLESGKGMDSVMNYELINSLIRYYKYGEYQKLKDKILEQMNEYPEGTINSLMNFTSTHDISRAIDIFGSNEFSKNKEWAWDLNNNDREFEKNYQLTDDEYQKGKDMYMAFVYTLAFFPGILSIFYGDEIGMQGLGNLANRKPFTWNKKDTELFEMFQTIGKIRAREKFLETASLELIDVNSKYLVFKRKKENEELIFLVNRTNSQVEIVLPNNYINENIIYKLKNSNKEKLDAYGAIVLKKVKK